MTPMDMGWESDNLFDIDTELHGPVTQECNLSQITAQVPSELLESLDAAAAHFKRSRADIIRQALELYVDDYDDLEVALERLRDPTDPVCDWVQVRHELLGSD